MGEAGWGEGGEGESELISYGAPCSSEFSSPVIEATLQRKVLIALLFGQYCFEGNQPLWNSLKG